MKTLRETYFDEDPLLDSKDFEFDNTKVAPFVEYDDTNYDLEESRKRSQARLFESIFREAYADDLKAYNEYRQQHTRIAQNYSGLSRQKRAIDKQKYQTIKDAVSNLGFEITDVQKHQLPNRGGIDEFAYDITFNSGLAIKGRLDTINFKLVIDTTENSFSLDYDKGRYDRDDPTKDMNFKEKATLFNMLSELSDKLDALNMEETRTKLTAVLDAEKALPSEDDDEYDVDTSRQKRHDLYNRAKRSYAIEGGLKEGEGAIWSSKNGDRPVTVLQIDLPNQRAKINTSKGAIMQVPLSSLTVHEDNLDDNLKNYSRYNDEWEDTDDED